MVVVVVSRDLRPLTLIETNDPVEPVSEISGVLSERVQIVRSETGPWLTGRRCLTRVFFFCPGEYEDADFIRILEHFTATLLDKRIQK